MASLDYIRKILQELLLGITIVMIEQILSYPGIGRT